MTSWSCTAARARVCVCVCCTKQYLQNTSEKFSQAATGAWKWGVKCSKDPPKRCWGTLRQSVQGGDDPGMFGESFFDSSYCLCAQAVTFTLGLRSDRASI